MERRLIQAGTGRVYIWTAALAQRHDMEEMPVVAIHPSPTTKAPLPVRASHESIRPSSRSAKTTR
jgi:hypothetical protein